MKRSLIQVAGVSLGSVGVAICLTCVVLAWIASNRIAGATADLFDSADRALAAVQQRVIRTRERVAAATNTATEVETLLLDWTNQETSQRETLQTRAAEKAEELAKALEQADLWLEVAESSVGLVRESLRSGTVASHGSTTLVDWLVEELSSVRAQLAEAKEVAARIEVSIMDRKSASLEARIAQAVPIAERVATILGSLDSRFGKVEERLSVAHNEIQNLATRALSWILIATIGISLFLFWMATGQGALCWLAWAGLRRRQP